MTDFIHIFERGCVSCYKFGNSYTILVGKAEGKKLIAKPGHRWKVNQEAVRGEADNISQVRRDVRCQVVIDTMIIFWVP
jgi:hypothetical protein